MSSDSEKMTSSSLLTRSYRLAKFAFEASTTQGGWKLVSKEHHANRLAVCQPCTERESKTCTACGCYLPAAAAMDIKLCESKTGVNKWDEIDAKYREETT